MEARGTPHKSYEAREVAHIASYIASIISLGPRVAGLKGRMYGYVGT